MCKFSVRLAIGGHPGQVPTIKCTPKIEPLRYLALRIEVELCHMNSMLLYMLLGFNRLQQASWFVGHLVPWP